jgi:hypothetical protein
VFSKVELVVNGAVVKTWTPHDTHPVLTYSLAGQQGDYLYVRAYQANESGWSAISSPIFITSNRAP